MTIISHQTLADNYTQANGRRYVRHEFTDHLGSKVIHGPIKVAGTDTETEYAAVRSALVAQIESGQADAEVQGALNVAVNGNNPDRVPDYQSQVDFDRRLLGVLMTVEDVHTFYAALPFFQAVESRGGTNANQRAAYLGVSTANYGLIADRFGDVQGIAFFLDNAKGQIWDDIPAEFK